MKIRDEIDLVRRTRAAHLWRSPTESRETIAAVRHDTGVITIILRRCGRVVGLYRFRTEGRSIQHRRVA